MNQFTIKKTVVDILIDDLINSKYEAVVIPTNSKLLPSGTLRNKALKQAGAKVQIECNQIINKITTIPVGNAVITSGGNLNSKFIIHVVSPKLGQKPEGKKLMLATWNSLNLADQKGIKSIAFPPISIEMFGFNAKICANAMLPTIKRYLLEKNKNLKKISIYLETLPDYKNFENVIDTLIN